MIRPILISTMLLSAYCALAQQQIPNASFESWEKSGQYLEPTSWNSLMTADMCMFCSLGASQRVFKEKRGLPGKGSCIRIESTSAVAGIVVNGSVTTGRVTAPTIRPSDGYNRTVVDNDEFNLKFTDRPDSLVFWAKYSITDKSDSALVSFLLHGSDEMTDPFEFTNSGKPLAVARLVFQTNSSWSRISVPFNYSEKFNENSAHLLATFSSSFKAGKGNSNATLRIDEVELIYNRPSQALKLN